MTPDRALTERIKRRLSADARPVRPLPPTAVVVAMLMAVVAGVAVAGGAVLGFNGWHRLPAVTLAAILVPLFGQAVLLAEAAANTVVPGARRSVHPGVLAFTACALMVAIFAALFHDYRTEEFVRQGTSCLRAGLLLAIPAAVAVWLLLRRGFAVDGRAAGVAMGALAGFAGLAVLEFHCPNFRMPHVTVWHTAVPAITATAGYFLGSKRRAAELMQ